jgi:hypothetical protein
LIPPDLTTHRLSPSVTADGERRPSFEQNDHESQLNEMPHVGGPLYNASRNITNELQWDLCEGFQTPLVFGVGSFSFASPKDHFASAHRRGGWKTIMRLACVRSLLILVVVLVMGHACMAQVAISVSFAPPELPVYTQPVCPGEDYIWTPGYWAWDPDVSDYYWVPGTWVLAPEPGFLWTPPYWAWGAGGYAFYPGYWGPGIGFYGGIVYGFGYFGNGYEGGRWENGHFFYNQSVNNVNVTVIHNVYNTKIVNENVNVTRVSFNGGNGGVNARPTPQQEAFAHENHVPATAAQTQHVQAAQQNTQLRASVNRGKPPVAATAKPGEFSGHDVVAASSGGRYTPPPANRGAAGASGKPAAENNPAPGKPAAENKPPVHPNDLPATQHAAAPNTGDPKLDKKYQQQQQKLYAQQDKERQKLQQQQDKEHQNAQKQQASQEKQQQMEQRHQQQTQQMAQKHTAQQQQLQQRQTAAPPATAHAAPPADHH